MLFSSVVLGILLALIYTELIATPTYKASATVVLESRKNTISQLGTVIEDLGQDETVVNSEIEILRSRHLLFRVVDQLQLTRLPEFNPSLNPPSFSAALQTRFRRQTPMEPGLETPDLKRERAVTRLTRRIKVEGVPTSLVFRVSVMTTDPDLSVRIANTICRLYVQDQKHAKLKASHEAQEWLLGRVKELQRDLLNSETRLAGFAAQTNLISETTLSSLITQLKTQRDKLASTRADVAMIEADSAPNASAIKKHNTHLRNRIMVLERSLTELKDIVLEQAEDMITQRQLERDVEASEEVYAHFLTRYKETAAQEGLHRSDSRVLSSAMRPLQPYSPARIRIVAFAGLIALFTSSGWVILTALLSTRIRNTDTLQNLTGLPVLCTLQTPQTKVRKEDSGYPISNCAISRLREVLFAGKSSPKVVMLLSLQEDAQKSELAMSLSGTLAKSGRRILLIDADPAEEQGRSLQSIPFPNFSSAADGYDLLDLTDAGASLVGLLQETSWADKIKLWRKDYDTVIINAPPALKTAGALSFAQEADAILLFAQWNQTDQEAVKTMIRMFSPIADKLLGWVVSGVCPKYLRCTA